MSEQNVGNVVGPLWLRHVASYADPDEVVRELARGSIVDSATATARRLPNVEAIRVGEEAITHAELEDRSRRVASWICRHGGGPGPPLLLAVPSSLAFVIGYLAALRTGGAVTVASASLSAADLATLIDVVRPAVAVATADCAAKLRSVGWAQSTLVVGEDGPGTMQDATDTEPAVDDPEIPSSAIAHVAFTSGTTGRPKAVPLTHANVLASARAVALAWRWSEQDVLVHALPLQHAHGLTAVHLAVLTGSRSVVLPRFDPATWCDAVARHRATVVFCVPTMYDRLLAWPGLAAADLSTLRLATSGSAPLSPLVSDAIAAALGQRPLERYGLTECGFVLSNLYDDRQVGSVGYPLPGIDVQLVHPDGTAVADGSDGEVVVRGPQVFAGYGIPNTDASSFLPGGWFRTGDLGRRAPSGAISITGRLKDLIISGGMNVSPREVELALEAQPGVLEAAVIGRPSARWGEEVCAYVVAGGSLDLDELAASMRSQLAPHKRPKCYAIVQSLPRNALGKLVRSQLPS